MMTQQVLQDCDIDRLGEALISLTKELWVVKDRQRVLEAALCDAGVLEQTTVDTYQPAPALKGQLEMERKRLIDGLIDVLVAPSSALPNK
jgi:hypothetical protein